MMSERTTGSTNPYRWFWRALVAFLMLIVLSLLQDGGKLAVGAPNGDPAPPACPVGRTVPIQPSPHIARHEAANVSYTSLPPTSGPHFAFALAPGIYADPIPDGLTIHALEHGHVAILYAPTTPEPTVRELTGIARRFAGQVVLAPHPRLVTGVAVTAWGCVLDDGATGEIEDFVRRLAGRYRHGWVARS